MCGGSPRPSERSALTHVFRAWTRGSLLQYEVLFVHVEIFVKLYGRAHRHLTGGFSCSFVMTLV